MNTPLLFVPGMMCDGRLFAPQIEAFSAQMNVQIAAVPSLYTITEIASELLVHAPPRFALCGLSMGGIIAMEMWRLAPERIEKLALLDTNPRAELAEVSEGRAAQIQRAANGQLVEMMQDTFIPKYVDTPAAHPAIVATCIDMAEAKGIDALKAQSLALRDRLDQCETLKTVNVPTLIMCGENDQLCPIERHVLMHDLIKGSVLEIIPNAGHLPTLEKPSETNKALQNWLAA